MFVVHETFIEMSLFQQTSPALKHTYICLHNNNSNDFAEASAGDVINVTSVVNHSSLVARGGTERIAASPCTTHLTSLEYK